MTAKPQRSPFPFLQNYITYFLCSSIWNRKYIFHDLYSPGLRKENVPWQFDDPWGSFGLSLPHACFGPSLLFSGNRANIFKPNQMNTDRLFSKTEILNMLFFSSRYIQWTIANTLRKYPYQYGFHCYLRFVLDVLLK